MAEILNFPTLSESEARKPAHSGPCQILMFTGVRVEYRDEPGSVALSRRARAATKPKKRRAS
ncbi:hypothetical protein [Afifella marina]|uniref:Uncharacterized protein n=1 Tax=Afifella marina DSM 2698 TaxID=1120955 RepID=A0A1G5MGQ1_AFIMA|nr:hypothetical protein [Afifella marina]MBK1625192.1 hypothetical protein [Afifella marina DSM 2698]MBK1628909.1 hypothetical protein [Afifella marina]MBK5918288.1 hypothetical protein [Afifella marina]RAI22808.1 hypothetical protein CH311_03920 [Afifella marina DSM 2698]SCZ23984.1 hypothetical protein SAMN03080610_00633 [Afifella marina DSM 2698]